MNAGGASAAAGGGAEGGESSEGGEGGEGTAELTDGYRNGSRLRAVVDIAGSAKRFVTWRDTELDIDCTFALDAEGTERCLPGFGVGFVAYGDEDCEERVVVYGAADDPPKYVTDPDYEFSCGSGAHYLAVGATVESVTTAYYLAENGDCTVGETLGADRRVAELASVVADSRFVAATGTAREGRDSRVSANVRTASDGSKEVVSFHDSTRNAECNPLEHQGSGYACVPWDRAYIERFFADDECEAPAAYHPGYAQQVCGRVPKIVQDASSASSDGFFEVGAEIEGEVYQNNGASCVPYEAPVELGASFYAVGAEVPWSDLVPLVSSNEGSGRIRQNTVRVPNGELIARQEFYDTEFDSRCAVVRASDSTSRCFPQTLYSLNLFTDAECSEGIVAVPSGTEMPDAGTFFSAASLDGSALLFGLGETTTEPSQTWQVSGAECAEAGVVPDQDWYATESHAPSEFVRVTREVE